MSERDDADRLAEHVGDSLRDIGESLAVVETCTGGRVGTTLTAVPGASDYLDRVLVPYDYDALRTLTAVDRETLDHHGAVSEAVTAELAKAARDTADVTWGVANTGIAGPGGGTPDKPVGTVFVAVAYAAPWESGDSGTVVQRYRFEANREAIRSQLSRQTLADLVDQIRSRR